MMLVDERRKKNRLAVLKDARRREDRDKKGRVLSSIWDRLDYYDELTDWKSISRRYFVIGAFDGALTILGVVLG
ncbi:MAG: hypothetical protein QXT63_05565, partial [Thermoplasmata archaeon]